jgi:hypothetical protein
MGKPSWLSARLAPPAGALRNMRMLELLQISMHLHCKGGILPTNAKSSSPTFIRWSLILVPVSLEQGCRKLVEAAPSPAFSSHSSPYAPRICRSGMLSTTTNPLCRGLLLSRQSPGVTRHCHCRAMAAAAHPSYCIPTEGILCKDCSWSGGEHS